MDPALEDVEARLGQLELGLPANEPCWTKGTPLAPTGQTMLDTVWVWLVYGSPISNLTLVGTPATAAESERVCRIPSRSVRPLSYQ